MCVRGSHMCVRGTYICVCRPYTWVHGSYTCVHGSICLRMHGWQRSEGFVHMHAIPSSAYPPQPGILVIMSTCRPQALRNTLSWLLYVALSNPLRYLHEHV
jgi:hypothetical protein